VHPFRFLRKPVIHAATPSEALVNRLSTAQGAFKVSFALALIHQLVAATASEECTPIKDRHPLAASCRIRAPGSVARDAGRHKAVGNVKNDRPDLIEPAPSTPESVENQIPNGPGPLFP
jgi:hypothetical protein